MEYTVQSTSNADNVSISFSAKPSIEIRNTLKTKGFRWSPVKRSWYASPTPSTKQIAKSFVKEQSLPLNKVINGDCINVMQSLPARTIDLIVTDPPYLVNYKDRTGRSIIGDNDGSWVIPAFTEMYRVLKIDSICIAFCGWNSFSTFIDAGKQAGFRTIGQIVWAKNYASSTKYLAHHHEQAIVLAKGNPIKPVAPLKSIQPWKYSGNRLHPTQKHPSVIEPLVRTFSKPNDIILDPFCGSGTTLEVARDLNRKYIGIDKDPEFANTANRRLES